MGKKYVVVDVDLGEVVVKRFSNVNKAIEYAYAELENNTHWLVMDSKTGVVFAWN